MLRTLTTTGTTALPIATVASPRLPAHNTRASGRWSFAAVAATAARPATDVSLSWLPRAACRPVWLAVAWVATTLAVEMPGQTQWLQKNPSVSPPGRRYAAAAFDVARGVVLAYGGWTSAGPPLGDFWAWNGTTWNQIQPAIQAPGLLAEAAMVQEGPTGMMLLFGGWNGTAASNQTWRWNGTSWTNVTPSQSPSPRFAHALVYDEQRGAAVLFGGSNGQAVLGDTWEWNTATSTWSNRTPAPPALSPPARAGAALVRSWAQNLLFGGRDMTNTVSNETWQWLPAGTWLRWSSTIPSPPDRSWAGSCHDSDRQRAVVFGGFTSGSPRSDTWESGLGTTGWTDRMVTGPSGRGGSLFVYDSVRHAAVLFSGSTDSGQTHATDTWTYGPIAHASYIATCSGCRVPPDPVPLLTAARGGPWIGSTFTAAITGAPLGASAYFMLFGLPGPSLPLCLLGRCDCTLCADPQYAFFFNPGLWWSIPIPNDIVLVGGQFDNQVFGFDVTQGSIRHMTNGCRATIGTR